MLKSVFDFKAYICFIIVLIQIITVLTFPSFSLSMFTEEDGTTINHEDRKEF